MYVITCPTHLGLIGSRTSRQINEAHAKIQACNRTQNNIIKHAAPQTVRQHSIAFLEKLIAVSKNVFRVVAIGNASVGRPRSPARKKNLSSVGLRTSSEGRTTCNSTTLSETVTEVTDIYTSRWICLDNAKTFSGMGEG